MSSERERDFLALAAEVGGMFKKEKSGDRDLDLALAPAEQDLLVADCF